MRVIKDQLGSDSKEGRKGIRFGMIHIGSTLVSLDEDESLPSL